jgi:spermidine/putrescine transport system substrate-binding protein
MIEVDSHGANQMKKSLQVRRYWIGFLVFNLILAGCTLGPSLNQRPDNLIFYNWNNYMPQGVLDAFTEETGIKVTYLTYQSMEEAVDQLRAGNAYDVVVLENNNIKPLAEEGILAPIDYQNVLNFKNVSPNFRDLTFDPSNTYSIPYDYGTTGLLVRRDMVSVPITRWADLWEMNHIGKIAARPLAYELIGIALKSLGYSLNTENPQELEAALERLLDLKPSLLFVDSDTSKAIPVLLNGEAAVMIGWGNDALSAQQQNETIAYLLPEEGTLLWGESLVIPTTSQNKEAAELFLNFLLRPEIGAQIVNEMHYATANEAAYPLILPELLQNPIIFPPAKTITASDWYSPLSPAGKKLYNEIWSRFMAH